MQSKEDIVRWFEEIAPVWDLWHEKKNKYYHDRMRDLIQGMVPPGLKILELGSGTGDLLASLEPSEGLGLNFSRKLTEAARKKHSNEKNLRFETLEEVDRIQAPDGFKADCVVLTNMLDYAYDVWDLLESLKHCIHEGSLIVVTTNNPLWAPLMRLASRLGLRIPISPRNYITNMDICSTLRLQGFMVVEEGLSLPVPVFVPLLGWLANTLLPELPLLRYASSIQYIAARPRAERRELSVSVVVPCHNEEGSIAECIRRVPDLGGRTEIVVADDGSTDGTRAEVLRIMRTDKRVRLVAADKNQGKVHAVRAGFDAGAGDVLIILDADMAVPPEELPKFIRPLREGTAGFVNGTRLIYPMKGKAMKMANYLGNKAFCFLVSWILRQRISDTLCGTKAMFKSDYSRMIRGDKERWGDFEMIFGAARLKLRVEEVPVHYHERRAGASKMKAFVEVWYFLAACLHGWRMLRFPRSAPWRSPEPEKGFTERTS